MIHQSGIEIATFLITFSGGGKNWCGTVEKLWYTGGNESTGEAYI
jgi:hypothetical protein